MHISITAAVCLFGVFGCAGKSAEAALVNVQFGQNNPGFGGPTQAYVGPAVLGGSGDKWNLFTEPFAIAGPFGFSASNQPLLDSSGSASGVTLSFSTPDTFIHVNNAIFSGSAYDALMTSFMFTDNNRNGPQDGPGTVTLSGLVPSAPYRLELYSAADLVNRQTLFTVNGASQTVTATASTTFTPGVNYADFITTADSTGTVSIAIARGGGGSLEGDLNGLQITSVPEPVSLAGASCLTTLVLSRAIGRKPQR